MCSVSNPAFLPLGPAPGPEIESEAGSVSAALCELFQLLEKHRRILHLHMPSAGGTVPPVYGFIEAIRTFGNWARDSKRPLRLVVHVGPQVLLNLSSRQLSLQELLTSPLMRFWVVVNAANHTEPTRRVMHRPPQSPLKEVLVEVLGDLDDRALKEWSFTLCPSPKRTIQIMTDQELDMSLSDAGLVFGSVLTLSRTHPTSDGEALLDRGT